MMFSRRWLLAACLVSLIATLGCAPKRPKTTPVAGQVTFKKQPLKGVGVCFVPKAKGRPAIGVTDENGHYQLKTFEPNDGAVPGEYGVSVLPPAGKAAKPGPADKTAGALPAKYKSSETSGLQVTVETGKQEYNFNLE